MSLLLANQDLSAAVVGTANAVDLSGANAQTAYGDKPAHARLYNESGCGLQVNIGQRSIDIVPAGGWVELEIHQSDGAIGWQVLYILPNAPVSRLISIFYKPEEDPPPLILGNSPIGLSGSFTSTEFLSTKLADMGALPALSCFDDTTNNIETIAPYQPASVSRALMFQSWNGTTANNVVKVGNAGPSAPMRIADAGGFISIGGQVAAGNFGVPVIVAQALRQHITVTTTTLVLSYAVTTSGIYRVSCYFAVNNGTSGQLLASTILTTDPDTGAASSNAFAVVPDFSTAAGHGTLSLNAANSIINGNYQGMTGLIAGRSGNNIDCRYQDPGGTPNDYVSFIIERMG